MSDSWHICPHCDHFNEDIDPKRFACKCGKKFNKANKIYGEVFELLEKYGSAITPLRGKSFVDLCPECSTTNFIEDKWECNEGHDFIEPVSFHTDFME
jgi:hypothetical protein